jgi:hypothetical protein
VGKNDPANCHVCGRHAIGIGLEAERRHAEPRWLCAECLPLLEQLKSVRRFDAYELRAVELAGEAAGVLLDSFGKTDLAELEAAEWTAFCRTMCQSFGDNMRRLIRNDQAPF